MFIQYLAVATDEYVAGDTADLKKIAKSVEIGIRKTMCSFSHKIFRDIFVVGLFGGIAFACDEYHFEIRMIKITLA